MLPSYAPKLLLITSVSLILLLISLTFSYETRARWVESDTTLLLPKKTERYAQEILKKKPPLYISKFWQNLTVYDIPNNRKLYNCTATVQMLYAKWIKYLAKELGYSSANEMLEYSAKIMAIKKAIEETTSNPLEFTLSHYTYVTYPKEIICWRKIEDILSQYKYSRFSRCDVVDQIMLEIGLIDPTWKSSTWKVVRLMLKKGYAVFQKRDKDGRPAIEIWDEKKQHLPLDPSATDNIIPGDILTGKYYATRYKDKYTTHLTVYIGTRNNEHYFAEQFGRDVRITSLNKIYKTLLKTGFEVVLRPIVIISPERTEEFLSTPLRRYDFSSREIPIILFFKDKAEAYLTPIQKRLNNSAVIAKNIHLYPQYISVDSYLSSLQKEINYGN
jgi:hypothetical protein